jgi:hypothetical protein
MPTNNHVSSRTRGSGGEDYSNRAGATRRYALNSQENEQDHNPAQDLYRLRTRLKEMRLGLDAGAASRGISLGSSYFDDYPS